MNRAKFAIQIIFSLAFFIFAGAYLFSLWQFRNNIELNNILEKHILVTIGIPLAIMTFATIVAIFEVQSGSVEFQIFDIKYKGAAGQIIMWVIVFLVIVAALKILW